MNFKYIPKLNWMYGYPAALIFMFLITLIFYVVYREKFIEKNKWL